MQEIAIPIRNEWPDEQTYKKLVVEPHITITKMGDKNFTKTHLHNKKRSLTIECLNDYGNALEKTINLFGDPNTKDTVINYFEQNNCSDTEEAILRKETSNLIRDFSRNIKEMRDISLEKLNKAEEEANNEKIFTRMSKKRDLGKARKAVEKAYKNMKEIKINMKEKGREKGIYSPKTIANFIKKIFNILNEAQELLSTLLEQYEGNSSHLIDGYKDLSTKKLKDMKKKLESNNSKESFGWNIENLEKAFKEIDRASSTMQNPKSKKGRKNIRSIIKDANSRIDIFIAETANKYSIEKNLKQFLKNAKNNLMGINEDTDELISRLVLWFPLGVREMARIYLTLLIATKLGPLYDSVREVSISTEKYKNRVSSSIEATSMLSIAGGIATTLGFAGIVGAFLAATIGYAIIGAIRAVNAGSDLDDSERALEETINWTNPETNPSQSKGKGDFANLPNSITDTQVMVNTLLTDVDLKETEAEQLKKSGKQTEAEILLAEATEKKNKARLFNAQLISKLTKDVSYRINEVKNLYKELREIITALYNFKFDEKQDAMKQIESFVKMMKEEADTNKDICIEIKAAESVIDQAKKVGVYTEELEKAVTSLKKAQKEVSAKATKVKESLQETINDVIISKYKAINDASFETVNKLQKYAQSLNDYSNELKKEQPSQPLQKFGIEVILSETKKHKQIVSDKKEQVDNMIPMINNLTEIGMADKLEVIRHSAPLSNAIEQASSAMNRVKETMVKKASDTITSLKTSNTSLKNELIPNLNGIKEELKKAPPSAELNATLKRFYEINGALHEMDNITFNSALPLVIEAKKIQVEMNAEELKDLPDEYKKLNNSLENAKTLVKEIEKIMPPKEQLLFEKNVEIEVLESKLHRLVESRRKVLLKKLKNLLSEYGTGEVKIELSRKFEEIKETEKADLQTLTERINVMGSFIYRSCENACAADRADHKPFNKDVPLKAINILKLLKEFLANIEKDYHIRMERYELLSSPPSGEPYFKEYIYDEEYAKKFPDFLSKFDGHIEKIWDIDSEALKEDKEKELKEKPKALEDAWQNILKELQEYIEKIKSSVQKSLLSAPKKENCITFFRKSLKSRIGDDYKKISSLYKLIFYVQNFILFIQLDAKSNKNNEESLEILKKLATRANKLLIALGEDLRYRVKIAPQNEQKDHKEKIENLEKYLKQSDETVRLVSILLKLLDQKKYDEIEFQNERTKCVGRLRLLLDEMKKDHKQQYDKLIPISEKILEMKNDDESLIKSVSDMEKFTETLCSEYEDYHPTDGNDKLSFLSHIEELVQEVFSLSSTIKSELIFKKFIIKSIPDKDLTEIDKKIKQIDHLKQQLFDKKLKVLGVLEGNPDEKFKKAEKDLETMLHQKELEEEPEEEDLGDTSKKK